MIADAIEEVHRQQKDVIGVEAAISCSDRLYEDGVRRKVGTNTNGAISSSSSKDTVGMSMLSSRTGPGNHGMTSSASSRFHNSPDPYPFRRQVSPPHSESQSTTHMRGASGHGFVSSKAQALRRAAVASARLHDE